MRSCHILRWGEVGRETQPTRWPGRKVGDDLRILSFNQNEGRHKALGGLGSFTFLKVYFEAWCYIQWIIHALWDHRKALKCSRKKKKEGKKQSRGFCGPGKRGVCVLHVYATHATLTRCLDKQILLQIMWQGIRLAFCGSSTPFALQIVFKKSSKGERSVWSARMKQPAFFLSLPLSL